MEAGWTLGGLGYPLGGISYYPSEETLILKGGSVLYGLTVGSVGGYESGG